MRIEYNRTTCSGWFQCVQEWDAFEMDMAAGKANLDGSEAVDGGVVARDVPDESVEAALAAAESCPVDAIFVFDDDGNQIVPEP